MTFQESGLREQHIRTMVVPLVQIIDNVSGKLRADWEMQLPLDSSAERTQRIVSVSLNYALHMWSKLGWDILTHNFNSQAEVQTHLSNAWDSQSHRDLSEEGSMAKTFFTALYPYMRALSDREGLFLDCAQWPRTVGNDAVIEASFIRVY